MIYEEGGIILSDKFIIEGSDSEFKSNPRFIELTEKFEQFAMKIQEDNEKMQSIANNRCLYPPYGLSVDTEAIRKAVSEYTPESIIPEGYFEKTQEYQQKSLETLQSINENTANLYTLVELINKNNETQREILLIISEILAIATAKSKEEAQSLFKKVMKKITEVTDSVDSIIKITGWATAVYNMVVGML